MSGICDDPRNRVFRMYDHRSTEHSLCRIAEGLGGLKYLQYIIGASRRDHELLV